MSEERRKRKAEREQQQEQQQEPKSYGRGMVVGVIAVLLVAAVAYLVTRKRTSPLDSFAQCLKAKQVKMYGAFWCPHCADQKEKFGSAVQYIPYIECGIKGSRAIEMVCVQADVKRFPTWVFPDGTRVEGPQSLEFLSVKSGCSLP